MYETIKAADHPPTALAKKHYEEWRAKTFGIDKEPPVPRAKKK
jgi:hypothetical protein